MMQPRTRTLLYLTGLLFIALALTASAAYAFEKSGEKICILTAAEKLPKIPGLAISRADIKALPEALKKGKDNTVLVDIHFSAAGQDAVATYVCATEPGKPAFVQPLGIQ